jgi:hypothetical protein
LQDAQKVKLFASDDFIRTLQGIAGKFGRCDLAEHLSHFGRFGFDSKKCVELDDDKRESAGRNKPVELKFYLRSVDGMIYYVGGAARRQLQHEQNDGSQIFIKRELPYKPYRRDACEQPSHDNECSYLFVLRDGNVWESPEFMSIDYEGRRFSVADSRDLYSGGYSSVVLDILRQQIAINSSAKSLPQSSVISIVGP